MADTLTFIIRAVIVLVCHLVQIASFWCYHSVCSCLLGYGRFRIRVGVSFSL